MKVRNGAQERSVHWKIKSPVVGKADALTVAKDKKSLGWSQNQESRASEDHMTQSTLFSLHTHAGSTQNNPVLEVIDVGFGNEVSYSRP